MSVATLVDGWFQARRERSQWRQGDLDAAAAHEPGTFRVDHQPQGISHKISATDDTFATWSSISWRSDIIEQETARDGQAHQGTSGTKGASTPLIKLSHRHRRCCQDRPPGTSHTEWVQLSCTSHTKWAGSRVGLHSPTQTGQNHQVNEDCSCGDLKKAKQLQFLSK